MPGDTNTPNPADYLGYDVYAQTIWARIETALNKDANGANELGDDPLVVGIFGEWGAGKSKLLKLVLERAQDLETQRAKRRAENDAGYGLTVAVLFQPWKYEHEPHLLVPLLLHILGSLKETLKKGQTFWEKAGGRVDPLWEKFKAALPEAIAGFETLLKGATVATAPTDAGVGFGLARGLANMLSKRKGEPSDLSETFSYSDDGRTYYEFHEHLQHMARPKKYPSLHPKIQLNHDIRINFVIFIDDLDRCLPEKAVETLELIKTVFNLESFAFVLALDEEVVERGIGHRYKDYALAGKKPEMPITGFEYLEKIVHLPFRLPALTKVQALEFIKKYESELLASKVAALSPGLAKERAQKREAWFVERVEQSKAHRSSPSEFEGSPDNLPRRTKDQLGLGDTEGHEQALQCKLHLGHFVVNCFDSYVPRKLIRIVELLHQLLDVLEERKRQDGTTPRIEEVRIGGAIDPRTLMAFIMLQLFQPELYRTLRRSGTGFDSLRKAFEPDTSTTSVAKELTAKISDSDLLHWAVYWQDATPPASIKSAHLRVPKLGDFGQKHQAQRLRLPIVERILEHRAVNRHAFDPLKLFAELRLMETKNPTYFKLPDENDHLYAVLVACESLDPLKPRREEPLLVSVIPEESESRTRESTADSAPSGTDNRERVEINNLAALFEALVDPEEPNQRKAATDAGLKLGQVLGHETAAKLSADCEKFFLQKPTAEAEKDPSYVERRYRLLRGLQYLAPYISREHGPKFWELVKAVLPAAEQDFSKEITELPMLKRRELWADVRSTLGADDRFVAPLWLPKEKYNGNSEENEPIPGFVRVPSVEFTAASKDNGSNYSNLKIPKTSDFFIARTLTTVDQYAAFIEEGGYMEVGNKFWDAQGIEWREDKFNSKNDNEAFQSQLKSRTKDLRGAPMRWAEQRAHGSRAVSGVSWFEARAYARWLNAKLSLTIASAKLANYSVQLPTDAQRERAARAKSFTELDGRKFPWGDDDKSAHLRANISKSEIGRTSVAGLFPANPLGVTDLSSNLWEWQDNLWDPKGANFDTRIKLNQTLETDADFSKSDRPALRGGSWDFNADIARVSVRNRYPPDGWGSSLGFRLVLSLAEK